MRTSYMMLVKSQKSTRRLAC